MTTRRSRDIIFSLAIIILTVREMQRSAWENTSMIPPESGSVAPIGVRGVVMAKPLPVEAPAPISNREMTSTTSVPREPLDETPSAASTEQISSTITSSLVVDLIGIGSQARPEYLTTQERTFGRHPSVRHFYKITEEDDTEPNCTAFLGEDNKWEGPSGHCFRHRNRQSSPYLLSKMANYYRSPVALSDHPYPAAWLCAQKRPIYGFLKAMQEYESGQAYPDYLIIMDDDSYFNLDIFETNMKDKDPEIPIVYGGEVSMLRITRLPPVKERFFFAYGGFGTIFSRGALKNMMKPIHCRTGDNSTRSEMERVACDRLEEDNIGEKQVFREGMSVLDLMEAYTNFQMFADYADWKLGYCLHSDWTVAYFVTYYEVSIHAVNTLYYDDYRHARLQKLDFMEEQKANPVCGGNVTCCGESAICHYQKPDEMERISTAAIAISSSVRDVTARGR